MGRRGFRMKCELCGYEFDEFKEEPYWLDDMEVCKGCYLAAKKNGT